MCRFNFDENDKRILEKNKSPIKYFYFFSKDLANVSVLGFFLFFCFPLSRTRTCATQEFRVDMRLG